MKDKLLSLEVPIKLVSPYIRVSFLHHRHNVLATLVHRSCLHPNWNHRIAARKIWIPRPWKVSFIVEHWRIKGSAVFCWLGRLSLPRPEWLVKSNRIDTNSVYGPARDVTGRNFTTFPSFSNLALNFNLISLSSTPAAAQGWLIRWMLVSTEALSNKAHNWFQRIDSKAIG